jgi:hypothetical protein
MTDEEFINALVAAQKPDHVLDAFKQYADAGDATSLLRKADQMERMRQQREGLTPAPMESGGFFQRLLQQGGGKAIPLS